MSGANADTGNLCIRPYGPDDIPEITRIYNHYVLNTIVTFEEVAVSEGEISNRLSSIIRNYPCLVAEDSGRIIGYAYASRWKERAAYRHTAETTIYLAEDATGKGVGTSLYRSLINGLITMDLHRIIAAIALPNPGSVRLHESAGFSRQGLFTEVGRKFDRWIDVGYWQRPLP